MSEQLSREKLLAIQAAAECIYTSEEVDAAIDTMAENISAKLADKMPLVLCTMMGGIVVTGKLLERLNFPLSVGYVHASRYQTRLQGSELEWIVRPGQSVRDRVVLIVDDIFDEGITLDALITACYEAGASHVYSAILLDKSCDKKSVVSVDFIGMTVDNRYVFGTGMDYKGYLRNVSGIHALAEME